MKCYMVEDRENAEHAEITEHTEKWQGKIRLFRMFRYFRVFRVLSFAQLLTAFLIILISVWIPSQAFGQKRSDRSGDKPETSSPAGPKRTDRAIPESERVKVITKTEFVRVAVRRDKGYLSVVAVPTAVVTLTPPGRASLAVLPRAS